MSSLAAKAATVLLMAALVCGPLGLALAGLLALLALASPVSAQIPGHTDSGVRNYAAHGTTDQPFTVQVVGARRTIENILLLKLSITNNGTGPLQPGPCSSYAMSTKRPTACSRPSA